MTRRDRWALAATLLVGAAIGLGFFTFGVARGYSYLGHDSKACANCHIMTEHFDAWAKGSHRHVATCNDCHTPHNFVGKYATKARNGFWHSFYFTVGGYPDPLRITERNRQVTEAACRSCHSEITQAIDYVPPRSVVQASVSSRASANVRPRHSAEPISCIRCHRYVGHWVR